MGTIEFLPTSGALGQAQPYARRNQPVTTAVLGLNPSDRMRLAGIEERWRFYQGLQWSMPRDDGDPLITANLSKMIILKLATWLVGKGIDIKVSEALSDVTLPILKEVWKYNKQAAFLLEAAIMAGVTGDCFVMVMWEEPTSVELSLNPYTQGKVRLRLLGSHQAFPQWDPRNREKLVKLRIITEEADNRLPDISPNSYGTVEGAHGRPIRRYVETYTADTIEEGYDGEEKITRPNALGEIPMVHWANLVFPNEYYGMSDLDGIIDLQRELNQKLTDQSDIVHIHAAPVTVITGAKSAGLKKGPRAMWAFTNANVKVFHLTSSNSIADIQAYINFIMQLIYDLSGVPEGSLGRIQPVSNTSAAALQLQFGPLMEAISRKAATMEPGLEKLCYFILRYDSLMNNKPLPVDICEECGGRILEFPEVGADGVTRINRECFIIDKQTLDFMEPDRVKMAWRRQFSFGEATTELEFGRIKLEAGKKHSSFWDPEPEMDLEKVAEAQKAKQDAQQEEAQGQLDQGAEDEHRRQLEQIEAKKPPPKEPSKE